MLAAVVASCVPAAEEVAPRGAVQVVLQPSSAARGEPFVTGDGWTLRFEQLALVGWVGATSLDRENGGGGSSVVIWNGALRAESVIRALPVGAYAMKVRMEGLYFSSEEPRSASVSPPPYPMQGIEPALAQRLLERPDNPADAIDVSAPSGWVQSGPGLVVVVRAEKAGKSVIVDLALAPGVRSFDSKVTVQVRANDLVSAEMNVAAERLFEITTGASLSFQPIADADRDGDGRVSASELRAVRNVDLGTCDAPSGARPETGLDRAIDDPCTTMLDRLAIAAPKMLVWP